MRLCLQGGPPSFMFVVKLERLVRANLAPSPQLRLGDCRNWFG